MGGNEYSLATLWQRLAFKFILIGFQLVILAFATRLIGEGIVEVEVLFLLGFVCYLLALIAVIFLIWLAEQTEKHPMLWTMVAMILSFLAGILLLVGVIVMGTRHRYVDGGLKSYSTTFVMAGSAMSIFGGVWLAIELRNHMG